MSGKYNVRNKLVVYFRVTQASLNSLVWYIACGIGVRRMLRWCRALLVCCVLTQPTALQVCFRLTYLCLLIKFVASKIYSPRFINNLAKLRVSGFLWANCMEYLYLSCSWIIGYWVGIDCYFSWLKWWIDQVKQVFRKLFVFGSVSNIVVMT